MSTQTLIINYNIFTSKDTLKVSSSYNIDIPNNILDILNNYNIFTSNDTLKVSSNYNIMIPNSILSIYKVMVLNNILSIYKIMIPNTILNIYKIKTLNNILNMSSIYKIMLPNFMLSVYNIIPLNSENIETNIEGNNIYITCPSLVSCNSQFTLNVNHLLVPTIYALFNNTVLSTSTNQLLLTQPSIPGTYLLTVSNSIDNPTIITSTYIQAILPKQQPISIYTYSNNESIVKILNKIQIQQTTMTRQSYDFASYSPIYENYLYSNIYNKIVLDDNTLEIIKPTQYNESFYQHYKKVQLPLSSSVNNMNTNQMFYNSYPYSGLLNGIYSSVLLNLTNRKSYTIIKDIYLNEQIDTQYLYIPPISLTGVVGYSIFINSHFLYNSNTTILSLNNTIPIVNYIFDNQTNIHNLFSPGRNRIVVILTYGQNYIYSDNNMSFQMDLIINNRPYIWSGIYNQNYNFIKQQNMNQNNLMINQRYDNIVFITR